MKRLKRILLFLLVFSLVLFLPIVSRMLDELCHRFEGHPPSSWPEIKTGGSLNNEACRLAFQYFKTHLGRFKNKNYLTIVDYTRPSNVRRMFILDMRAGVVERHLVSHGKNSGLLYATDFSNEIDSLKSCKGFFLTGESYQGKHGTSLLLHGLEKDINDNAYKRGIVIHGAEYAGPQSIHRNSGRLGLSWGCPAVPPEEIEPIVSKIQGGSLLYIHAK